MFSDVKQFSLVFIPINWLICIIVTAILYFVFSESIGLGYLLGSITSFLTFGLLMKNTQGSIQPGKTSVKTKILGGNVVRLIISLLILYLAYELPKFNFWATLAGLLVLKTILIVFVLVRYLFFKDKEEIKNDTTI